MTSNGISPGRGRGHLLVPVARGRSRAVPSPGSGTARCSWNVCTPTAAPPSRSCAARWNSASTTSTPPSSTATASSTRSSREALGATDDAVVVDQGRRHPRPRRRFPLRLAQRPEELRADVEANLPSPGHRPPRRASTCAAPTPAPDSGPRVIRWSTSTTSSPCSTALRDEEQDRCHRAQRPSPWTDGAAPSPAGVACVQNSYSLVSRADEDMLRLCAAEGHRLGALLPARRRLPGHARGRRRTGRPHHGTGARCHTGPGGARLAAPPRRERRCSSPARRTRPIWRRTSPSEGSPSTRRTSPRSTPCPAAPRTTCGSAEDGVRALPTWRAGRGRRRRRASRSSCPRPCSTGRRIAASKVAKPWQRLRSRRSAWSTSDSSISIPRRTAVNAPSSRSPDVVRGSSGPDGSWPIVAAYRPGCSTTKARKACAAAARASLPARPCTSVAHGVGGLVEGQRPRSAGSGRPDPPRACTGTGCARRAGRPAAPSSVS